MSQVSPHEAKAALEAAFYRWGLPHSMRFDNGPPFANTTDRHLPTALAVWLTSLGIEVIFNRVYSPQQNGSVECTQRISSRWANFKACSTPQALQQALDKVSYEHIEVYRQRHNGDRTRAEAYPGLFDHPRCYDPNAIDPERVKSYLMRRKLIRKVYGNGCLSLFGAMLSAGNKYKHQQVEIGFNPSDCCWQVSLVSTGQLIKQLAQLDLSKEAIEQLTVFQRT